MTVLGRTMLVHVVTASRLLMLMTLTIMLLLLLLLVLTLVADGRPLLST